MSRYYLSLALRSVLSTPALSALILLSITLGISAPATMLIVLGTLGVDPVPTRSSELYHLEFDPRPDSKASAPSRLLPTVTLHDATALQRALPSASTFTSSNWLPAKAADTLQPLLMVTTRAMTHEAFAMFDIPLQSGAAWRNEDDVTGNRVAVISKTLASRLFPNQKAVGQLLHLATRNFRVIGVAGHWNPQPRFHDLGAGAYGATEDVFIPLTSWLDLPQDYGYGKMSCWDDAVQPPQPRNESCTWLQFWTRLRTNAEAKKATDLLQQYADQRHQLDPTVSPRIRLLNLKDWLSANNAVPSSVRVQAWLSAGILLICLLNASGLLLTKFASRIHEIGIRRALGATRGSIFSQYLMESLMYGVLGGVAGIPLTMAGLALIRKLSVDYTDHLSISPTSFILCPLLALLTVLAAALVPAWRATTTPPTLQIASP